jgi:hypothetical protein
MTYEHLMLLAAEHRHDLQGEAEQDRRAQEVLPQTSVMSTISRILRVPWPTRSWSLFWGLAVWVRADRGSWLTWRV